MQIRLAVVTAAVGITALLPVPGAFAQGTGTRSHHVVSSVAAATERSWQTQAAAGMAHHDACLPMTERGAAAA